jgi:hypothetical protein
MSQWNDDDRAPLQTLSVRSSSSVQEDEYVSISQMLKELIQEEREKLYTYVVQEKSVKYTTAKIPLTSVSHSHSWSCDSCDEISEDDTYEDYVSQGNCDEETVNEEEIFDEDAQTENSTMNKVIENQVYRKFGYV